MDRIDEIKEELWSETSLKENEIQILHDWLQHPGINYPNIELSDEIMDLCDEYRELKV
jgi:hypothetical protein